MTEGKDNRSGLDVEYYLIEVKEPKRLEPYIAEVEDLIEALNMTFAEGNVLKALVRNCKNRQGEGKALSKPLYDAEKISYYGARILAQEKRKQSN